MVTKKIKDLTLDQFVLNYKYNEEFPTLKRAYDGITYLLNMNPNQAFAVWELSKKEFPKELANYDYTLIEY